MATSARPESEHDRARACLLSMAIGDAMGMPTQMLSADQIQHLFGRVTTFLPGPDANWISHGVPAGTVTDDTEQAIIIGEVLIQAQECGRIHDWDYLSASVAAALVRWFDQQGPDLDRFAGPSSRRAIAAIRRGDSLDETGQRGDTNGASMRIAPVGVACAPGRRLLDMVEAVSKPTHHTGLALSGAALVATAISSAIGGATLDEAIARGLGAAEEASLRGHYVAGASVTVRTRRALELASGIDRQDEDAVLRTEAHIAAEIGTGVQTQEAVPTAVGILYLRRGDPWAAIVDAANAGGDTDTIAAIAGALGGAVTGTRHLPPTLCDDIEATNRLGLDAMVARLLDIRSG
ncbi:MAG: ADP-ribosylglycohydrolase family protein [Candidatus Dormibacteria bacterium]